MGTYRWNHPSSRPSAAALAGACTAFGCASAPAIGRSFQPRGRDRLRRQPPEGRDRVSDADLRERDPLRSARRRASPAAIAAAGGGGGRAGHHRLRQHAARDARRGDRHRDARARQGRRLRRQRRALDRRGARATPSPSPAWSGSACARRRASRRSGPAARSRGSRSSATTIRRTRWACFPRSEARCCVSSWLLSRAPESRSL